MSEKETALPDVLHYGPLYGRSLDKSMGFCDSTPLLAGQSRTLTRSLGKVTCPDCLRKLEEAICFYDSWNVRLVRTLTALELVSRLLAEAGYEEESSARHNLAIAMSELTSP